MANKKRKNTNQKKQAKKITVEDLKKKNISVKKKSGSSGSKTNLNKNKSVPKKNATEVNKNTPKKVAIEEKSVENKNYTKKNPNVKKKAKTINKTNTVDTSKKNIKKSEEQKSISSKIEIVKENKEQENSLEKNTEVSQTLEKDTKVADLKTEEVEETSLDRENIEEKTDINENNTDHSKMDKPEKANNQEISDNTLKIDTIDKTISNKNKNNSFKKKGTDSKKNKKLANIGANVNKKEDSKDKNKQIKKKQIEKVYKSPSEIDREIKYRKHKTILKAISFICIFILIVEFGIFIYMKCFNVGDNSYDALNSVILDHTSLVSVGSSYFKYSSNYEETNRIEKGRLVRYDKRGKLELEVQYDRGVNSTFTSVVTTSDGYYVVGSSEFSKEQEKNHTRDALLIKYDLDGKKIWEKSYSVLSDTRFNKIILVEDGLVVVGQSIYENMEMGNHTTGGGIIVKYSFDGELIWASNHGGNKSGNFNDVISLDGNYYAVGKDSKDTGVLVKFASNGKYVFHKNYSYTDSLGFSAITTDGVNIYVVGGKKILSEQDANDENSKRDTSNTDAVILKYSQNGEIVKEKLFGGSGHDRYNAVVYYGGFLYLVGSTASNDSGLRVSSKNGEVTAMLIKCDTGLSIDRKEVFGGSHDDNMLDLITDGSNVYMVGYSNSKDSNIKTEHDNGSDFISKLVKVDYRFRILMKK